MSPWPDLIKTDTESAYVKRASLALPEVTEPVAVHSGQIWRAPYDGEYYLLQAITEIDGAVRYVLMQINEYSAYPDHATFTIVSVDSQEVAQPLSFFIELFKREGYVLIENARLGLVGQLRCDHASLSAKKSQELHELIRVLTRAATVNGDYQTVLGNFACGRDGHRDALTMLGYARMMNIWDLCDRIFSEEIPGDLCECGVWRGGATILMKALVNTYHQERKVYVCDSFAGFRPITHSEDLKDERTAELTKLSAFVYAVPLEQVQENFRRTIGLDNVVFVKGYFEDSLKDADIGELALLRCDADLYEPTLETLRVLYPRLHRGGYVIVDDYANVPACRKAVHDYFTEQHIQAPIHRIDWTGVYFQKP